MSYFNIIYRAVTIIGLCVLIPFSLKMAEESEMIHQMYLPVSNSIAEQECYNRFGKELQIEMLKVGDEILFHSIRGYQNWILTCGITTIAFLIALTITVMELKNRKHDKRAQ